MFGNWLKTTILMAGIVALFGVVGAALEGANGMLLALVLGGAMNIFACWFSDAMVLRTYSAQEVDAASAPGCPWSRPKRIRRLRNGLIHIGGSPRLPPGVGC